MRHRTVVLATLSTAFLLAAVPSTAFGAVGSVVTVSGPSPYAACTIGGPGTNYANAEVEPYLAVNPANPKNLIGAWQQDRWSNGGAHGLVSASSADGGATWTETTQPFSACAPGGLAYERASDPWVTIGPDGTAYSNAIVFDQSDNKNGVAAVSSTDGGKTWSHLTVVDSHPDNLKNFDDKNSIAANPVKAGVAYSVWDDLIEPNANPYADQHASAYSGPGYFSKTTDGGKSWSTPKAIFPSGERKQTIGNQILVDPNHPDTLYDVANWITNPLNGQKESDNVAFVKSTDGGGTWTQPVVIAAMNDDGVTDPNTGAGIRTGEIIPEPAVGADGSLVVVWQDAAFSGGSYDEIAFTRSTDGGATWTSPTRISTPTGRAAWNPTVRVAADGTIGVTYFDFRNLAAGNTTTLPTDYWFTSSSDGGTTWSADQHLAGPFDLLTAPQAGGYFVGDYAGLVTSGSSFLPFWVATTTGTGDPTDTYFTTVSP